MLKRLLLITIILCTALNLSAQYEEQRAMYKQITGKDLDEEIKKANLNKTLDQKTIKNKMTQDTIPVLKNKSEPDSLAADSLNNQIFDEKQIKAKYESVNKEKKINKNRTYFERYVDQTPSDPYDVSTLKQFKLDLSKMKITTNNIDQIPNDYILTVGDEVVIDIWGAITQNYILNINNEGYIIIPKIGRIDLKGVSYAQAKTIIAGKLKPIDGIEYAIRVGSVNPVRVKVTGSVYNPGVYYVSPFNNLMEILAIAGGLTENASLRNIKITGYGGGVKSVDVYQDIFLGNRNNFKLSKDDEIYIPLIGDQVAVAGNVKREGIFEIKKGDRLKDILKITGIASFSNGNQIEIERINNSGKRQVLTTSLKDNSLLQDGDIVRVFSNLAFNKNFVKLDGNFRYNKEIEFVNGMKLKDIFAGSDILKDNTDLSYAHILRKGNLGFDNKIIQFSINDIITRGKDAEIQLQSEDVIRVFPKSFTKPLENIVIKGEVRFPATLPYSKGINVRSLINMAGGTTAAADTANVLVSRYEKYHGMTYTSNADIDTFMLAPRDTVIVNSFYVRSPYQSASIIGEVKKPGKFEIGKSMSASTILSLAGGVSGSGRTDSLMIMRGISRTNDSIKVIFASFTDLNDIMVYPNDIVSILPIPDYDKTIKITVMGEVKYPGTYLVSKYDKLSSVLKRCCGFTGFADVNAAHFLRKTVKNLQNAQFKSMKSKLVEELSKVAITEDKHEIFNALRFDTVQKIDMPGRIVFELNQDITKNDISIQNEDVLIIPSKENFVTVFGEVFQPNAILFDPKNSTVGHYIDRVGGLNQFADKGEIKIIKRNGEIYRDNSWFFNSIMSYKLEPGDAVFAPFDYSQIGSKMALTKDIISMLYQVSLTAANSYIVYEKLK